MIIVTAEAERRLVRARMGGLLELADVEAFSREEQRAVGRMGWNSGEFDLLIETEGSIVQTQEVMEAFGALLLHSPLKARKIATVRHGALSNMQTRRIAKLRSNFELFDSLDEAEAWLED